MQDLLLSLKRAGVVALAAGKETTLLQVGVFRGNQGSKAGMVNLWPAMNVLTS